MNTQILIFIALFNIAFITNVSGQNVPSKDIHINEGSGSFLVTGGVGHEQDSIIIFYHRPKNMSPKSKILMVIPGAGRNGDTYRDSWVEISEKHSVLILSPSYDKKAYPYESYHLGGIIEELDTDKGISFKKNSNQVYLDESVVKFEVNLNSTQWLYHDFDRIFEIAKKAVNSKQRKYDMFGHSAGGQILHRFVLFHPHSKANRILASNAGTYTLVDTNTTFPFGLKNTNIPQENLKHSFKKQLVIFLGELDNADEQGGLLLRSKTVDKQGTHRLARGNYFYEKASKMAKALEMKLNWELEVIPDIGHNQRKMAKAAGVYLYGE